MKYDGKTILVLLFLVTTVSFGYKWYYGDNGGKSEIKELNAKYSKLEEAKKEKDLEIIKLEEAKKANAILDKKLIAEIAIAKAETAKAIDNANKSKLQLEKLTIALSKSKKEIEAFVKNPPNREGDALLISIKNHTK